MLLTISDKEQSRCWAAIAICCFSPGGICIEKVVVFIIIEIIVY